MQHFFRAKCHNGKGFVAGYLVKNGPRKALMLRQLLGVELMRRRQRTEYYSTGTQ